MKYTPSHEWIQIEGAIGTVGITEYAQKELGEVVYVELPVVGKSVLLGEEVAVLESTKAAADIYAPVSGEVIAVNEALRQSADLVNASPEQQGWLFKMKLHRQEEDYVLLTQEQYKELLGEK